jgi:hypothetical protein
VSKAKKLAKNSELIRQELLLTEMQEELLLKDQKYFEALEVYGNDKKLMHLIDNLLSMQEITTKGYHENLSRGVIRNEKELTPFKELLNNELVSNENKALTNRSRLHQISVQLTYNMVAGNNVNVIKYTKQILDYYESHPHLIDYTPIGYVSSCFILGNSYLSAGENNLVLNTIERFNKIEKNDSVKKSQKAISSLFFYKNILLLQLDHNTNLEQIEKEINTHINFIGKAQLYDLYFQMCLSFFTIQKFKKALKWSNEIINDIRFKSRDDFMISVRLVNLLIHFELGNDFTLEYISKSTYSYLRKKNQLYNVEKLLIKFFTKYDNYVAKKSVNDELIKLAEKLSICKQDKYEEKAFQYFDYHQWIKKKIDK